MRGSGKTLWTGLAVPLLLLFSRQPLPGAEADTVSASVPPIEWLIETLPEELSDEELQDWQEQWTERFLLPIDLNRATGQELKAAFPFLSEHQIYRLRQYRDERGGALQEVYDLKWIPSWDKETIARVAPYVTVIPFSRVEETETRPAPLLGCLYSSFSMVRDTMEETSFKESLAPFQLRTGFVLSQQGLWKAGIVYGKYRGEPVKAGTWRYAVEIEHLLPLIDKMILGHFKGQWGCGLILSRSAWSAVTPASRSAHVRSRISPSWSTMRDRTLRGISLSGQHKGVSYNFFYSYAMADGVVDEDKRLIRSIKPNMRFTSEKLLRQRGAAPMHTAGGQLLYERADITLSVQTLYSSWGKYRLSYLPGYKNLDAGQPVENHWLTSIYYRWLSGSKRLECNGEAAANRFNSFATIHHIRYRTRGQQTILGTLYYMAPQFASYYGHTASHFSRVGNDLGLKLHLTSRIKSNAFLQGSFETYQSVVPRYARKDKSWGIQSRVLLNVKHRKAWQTFWLLQAGRSDRELSRLRLSSTAAYSTSRHSVQAMGSILWRKPIEGQKWQQGYTLSLRLGERLASPKPMEIDLAAIYYHTEHYRVAPYVYLPSAPYSHSLLALNGHGVALGMRMRFDLSEHWSLQGHFRYQYDFARSKRLHLTCYLSYRF